MADIKRVSERERTFGDAAVDGLLAGGAAGILMIVYLLLANLAQGQSVVGMLARFDPGPAASPVTGGLIHLAVSGVYGLVYGLGLRLTAGWPGLGRLPSWLAGVSYGLLLLAVAWAVILPGTNSAVRAIPLVHLAIAHVIYGLSTGILIGRR